MTLSQSLFVIGLLIAASAFFSMAEISLAAARRLRLRQMADEGDARADRVLRMQEQPGDYFTVVVCPVGMDRSEAVKATAEQLYADLLAAGVDVILDDRGERPGAMFADWELIGVPHRVVLGDRGLKEGLVEYQHRRDAAATPVPLADVVAQLKTRLGL